MFVPPRLHARTAQALHRLQDLRRQVFTRSTGTYIIKILNLFIERIKLTIVSENEGRKHAHCTSGSGLLSERSK